MWPECRVNGNFFELGFELVLIEDKMVEIGQFVRKEVESRDWIGVMGFYIRMCKNIGCV